MKRRRTFSFVVGAACLGLGLLRVLAQLGTVGDPVGRVSGSYQGTSGTIRYGNAYVSQNVMLQQRSLPRTAGSGGLTDTCLLKTDTTTSSMGDFLNRAAGTSALRRTRFATPQPTRLRSLRRRRSAARAAFATDHHRPPRTDRRYPPMRKPARTSRAGRPLTPRTVRAASQAVPDRTEPREAFVTDPAAMGVTAGSDLHQERIAA
jgi:hypothetical protein